MRFLSALLVLLSLATAADARSGAAADPVADPQGRVEGSASVPNNAALKSLSLERSGGAVTRDGFAESGDGGGARYVSSKDACSAPDEGAEVPASWGGCWHLQWPATADIRLWGAVADNGRTDSGPAITRALVACQARGGGHLMVPALGAAFGLHTRVATHGNACALDGVAFPGWSGTKGTLAQYAAAGGSWLACYDASGPCLDFGGSGDAHGLAIWNEQPVPSDRAKTAWTPLDMPFSIVFRQNFSRATDIYLANVSRGIAFECPVNATICGTFSGAERIWGTGFRVGLRTAGLNDTFHCSDIHLRPLWQVDNANVIDWMEGATGTGAIGWDIQYLDNAQCEDVEFYKQKIGLNFTDGTAVYGNDTVTHAAENLQFRGFAFNQVVQFVNLATGTTAVSGIFADTLAQTDTDTNRAAAYAFNFASDKADVAFRGGRAGLIGYNLFAIGGGAGGRLRITGFTVGAPSPDGRTSGYGSLQTSGNSTHFAVLAKGSVLDLPEGTAAILPGPNAGSVVACASPGKAATGSNCGSVAPLKPAVTPKSP